MVLIYSRDTDDFVNNVINYLKIEFARIGDREEISLDDIDLLKSEFIISNKYNSGVNLFKVKSIWYNGGIAKADGSIYENKLYQSLVESFLEKNKHKSLGKNISHFELNKFDSCLIAQKYGIKVPDTIITNNKKTLITFFELNTVNGIICKRITDGIFYKGDDFVCKIGDTFALDKKLLNMLPDNFAISLFQKRIICEFEIRVFYLLGNFYSMAIFPSEKKVDIRQTFTDENTRMVPYKLPNKITQKLKKVLNEFKLNYCSIDLMFSDEEYFFLEINPIGQVQFLNQSCNYYLEKKIADYLNL